MVTDVKLPSGAVIDFATRWITEYGPATVSEIADLYPDYPDLKKRLQNVFCQQEGRRFKKVGVREGRSENGKNYRAAIWGLMAPGEKLDDPGVPRPAKHIKNGKAAYLRREWVKAKRRAEKLLAELVQADAEEARLRQEYALALKKDAA